jgi:chitinase
MRHRSNCRTMAATALSTLLAAAGVLAGAPGPAAQANAPAGQTNAPAGQTKAPAAQATAPAGQTKAPAAVSSGGISVAYFDQWSIYGNNFDVKNLVTSGEANHINYLIYDFENIDPNTHQCFEAEKGVDQDPAGETDPNAGDGAGDVDADYGKDFSASQSVNGQADTFGQLAGNFHQLQELKAAYPNLKILLSIGGWTYSKYFSDAAATAASRQAFVSSCVNMFIKGNLPPDPDYGVTPAAGAIAGLFDGFDIDWEYPGSAGHVGNHVSSADTQNYTLLLQEFRNELNTQSQSTGKTYYLSAALPSGQDKIANVQTGQIAQYLNFGDLMSYDMHVAWNPTGPSTGPTDFQDPIYTDPDEPGSAVPPGNEKYSISNAVSAWVNGDSQYGIAGGFPANKLTLGLPFYYRGWTGVPAGGNHGLFQSATGAANGATYSGNVPGIQMYKELTGGPYSSGSDVVDNPADTYYDTAAEAAYFYDGSNWWTGLSPQSIQARIDFMHCQGMAGVMMFSMYDLDPGNPVLFNDVQNDLGSTPSGCGAPQPGNDFSVSVSPASGTVTAGGSATATIGIGLVSGSSQTVSLSASGTPSGVSVSFSPSSATTGGSSSMTVSTASSTAAGTYPITITGQAASGSHTATYTLTVNSAGGGGGGGGSGALVNSGFETGSLSPWTCQPGGAVVTSPVHSGGHALQVAPTSGQTGECDQTVTLSPDTSYTLSAWVQGSYSFIGVSGGATASTWTSSTGWTQLKVSFTTGSSGTVTVYVHGWYSQGNVYADDFSVG